MNSDFPPPPEPLPVSVADNHTHFAFTTTFHDDDAPSVDVLIAQAVAVGVDRFIEIGCDLPSAEFAAELAASRPDVLAGVAIHPNEAPPMMQAGTFDAAMARIAELAEGDRVRVIGETGLDTFRTGPEGADAQRQSFRAHIALAKELGKALQIHDRDAHREVLEVLAEDGAPERTVFHCFSGDAEMAETCVQQGWFLSYAGTVTFKNAEPLRDALAVTPLDRILVETDAPYLTPHPHRGKTNASYLIPLTMRMIAEVKGVPLDVACAAVSANSERVYGPWA